MKPTTDEMLAWAREAGWMKVLWKDQYADGMDCIKKLATLAYSAGAAEMRSQFENKQLWLWRNGDHYLAFEHLYPCYSPGGDPMTLGEPAAVAFFRESYDRATGGEE